MSKQEFPPNLCPISLKGSGTFGKLFLGTFYIGYVFEALDKDNNRTVAVKRVRKAEKKMSREYQILSELKGSKHCIELLDVFYTVGSDNKLTQNFVMEYIPESLENYLTKHKKLNEHIEIENIKKIMRQLLEGLAFIHAKKICHRDLKPDNVLLDHDHNVKLCDFGSSKKLDGKSKTNIPHVVSRYYRAPELLLCHTDYTIKIDIWAAGCILVELFTKEPLFPGKSEGLQLLEIMAVLGSPSDNEKPYLYSQLSKSARKSMEELEQMQPIDLTKNISKHYKTTDVNLAMDLAKKMLQWNPKKRISAKQALKHEFFK